MRAVKSPSVAKREAVELQDVICNDNEINVREVTGN